MIKPFDVLYNAITTVVIVILMTASAFSGGYQKYLEIEIAQKDTTINYLLANDLRYITNIDIRSIDL